MDAEGPISHSNVRMPSFHISGRIWGYQEDGVRSVAPNGQDKVLQGASKVVRVVMEGVTCGSIMVLSREQTRGCTRGQTRGRRFP